MAQRREELSMARMTIRYGDHEQYAVEFRLGYGNLSDLVFGRYLDDDGRPEGDWEWRPGTNDAEQAEVIGAIRALLATYGQPEEFEYRRHVRERAA